MRPWQRQESEKNHLPKLSIIRSLWMFYLIIAIGFLFSLLLWYIFLLQDAANLNKLMQVQTQHISEDIELQFELRIAALKHMAKHLYDANTTPLNNWQDVIEYSADYGSFEGLVWLDSHFKTLQRTVPLNNTNFDKLLQQYVLNNTAAILNAANKYQIWLSPPFDLNQWTGAFIVTTFRNSKNEAGYLVSLVNFKSAFQIHLNPHEYALQVFYDNQKVFEHGRIEARNKQISQVSFMMYGMDWKLLLQPSARLISAIKTSLPLMALITGIIITLLFAIASYLAQLARERTKALQKINLDLQKEITEREEAEAQKKLLERGLMQGQKLQAIGTLAGGIAHDFNNLLYAIIGYTEMAQEDAPKDSLTYQNLGKVLEASHRGQDLISRILAFSRRQHHELKSVNLTQCIKGVLDLLTPTVPASITINFINDLSKDCMIMADSTGLHQVIVNIINNAVDAMEGDGVITLKLSHLKETDDFLKQFVNLQSGNYCRVDIIDTGHGMKQSTLKRVFEPFFTTKEVGKGTGLGLVTAHTIVKEHNGDIVVTSKLGSGTQFTIVLPVQGC